MNVELTTVYKPNSIFADMSGSDLPVSCSLSPALSGAKKPKMGCKWWEHYNTWRREGALYDHEVKATHDDKLTSFFPLLLPIVIWGGGGGGGGGG